ncbi:MAG: S8 family serine peptidase [Alphaproteobacteria bacterium]|nr:S8 family serine peptidase [Alphaproteobacteria bacterium]
MKEINRVLTVSLATVFMATSALANDPCKDAKYREMYPEKCEKTDYSTAIWLGVGGLGLVGGAVALMAIGNSGGTSDNTSSATTTTVSFRSPSIYDSAYLTFDNTPTYKRDINSVANSAYYIKNNTDYDAIGLKYAHARGYEGNGSNIKIMDNFYSPTNHGNNVTYFATTVAPSADIDIRNVAKSDGSLDFEKFALNIDQTKSIYNASWEITNIFATQATTRSIMSSITGNNFITKMENAAQQGSIFIFAAGNQGMTESSALSALPIAVEGLQGHFINVVAFDTKSNTLASFSNQCGITQDYCIAAPGENLATDTNKYLNGTSFAAPIVSGAVAILQEKFPYLNSNQITEILLRTATDLGTPGIDEIYGWGLLNLDQATKPVGEMSVAISGRIVQRLVTANVTPAIAESIAKSGAKMAAFDEYGRSYTQNLIDNVQVVNRSRGLDRLHRSEPDTIQPKILEFGSSDINLLEGTGFMQIDSSQNAYIATNHTFSLTDDTRLFTRAQFGTMSARPAPESVINNFSNIFTAAATVSLEHKNWKFEVSLPETIISGNMTMTLATERLRDGSIQFDNYNFDLSTKPTFEYALSYKNITAGFVDNPYGKDEIYILAKTHLMF